MTALSALISEPIYGRTWIWPEGQKFSIVDCTAKLALEEGEYDLFVAGWETCSKQDETALKTYRDKAHSFFSASDPQFAMFALHNLQGASPVLDD